MNEEDYNRLRRLIEKDLCEFVKNRKSALKKRFLWEINIIVLIPAALSIIGYIVGGVIPTIMVVIMALINFFDRLRQGFTILVSYHSDIEQWNKWYESWRLEIKTIAPEDEKRIQEIKDKLMDFFREYREKLKLPS